MRSALVLVFLLSVPGLAGCQAQPPAGPEPPLSVEQKAAVEQAQAVLAELKAGAGKPEIDTATICRRFFDAKRQLLDVGSASLDELWAAGDKHCGLAPAHKFLLDRASKDLKVVKAQIGQSNFDPQYRCLSVLQALGPLGQAEDPAVQKLLSDGRRTCMLDAWLDFGSIQLAKAKIARDKDPTAKLATECGYLQISLDSIAPEYRTEVKVQELAQRRDELCTPPKHG